MPSGWGWGQVKAIKEYQRGIWKSEGLKNNFDLNLEKLPRRLPEGSPLVPKTGGGKFAFLQTRRSRKGKAIFCRGAIHLIQMQLWFEDRKYLLQVEYGSWTKWKNRRKRVGEKKRQKNGRQYPLLVGGKSKGSVVGRPFSGGYLFQVRGYREYLFHVETFHK